MAADPASRSANASGTIVIPFPSGNTGDSGGISGGAADTENSSEDGVSGEETTDISVEVSLPVTWTEDGKAVCYVTFELNNAEDPAPSSGGDLAQREAHPVFVLPD